MSRINSYSHVSPGTANTVLGTVCGICLVALLLVASYVFYYNRSAHCISCEEAARKTGMTLEEFHALRPGKEEMHYPKGLEYLAGKPKRLHLPMREVDTERVQKTLENVLSESNRNRQQMATRRRNPPLLKIYEQKRREWLHRKAFPNTPLPLLPTEELALEPPTLEAADTATVVSSQPQPQRYHSGKIIVEPPKSQKNANATSAGTHRPAYDREQGLKILDLFNQKAETRLREIAQEVHDYACILYKWDQTNIISQEMDVMRLLIREKPFSVYAKFEYPKKIEGREWIYWEGHYDGNLLVNSGPKTFNRTLLLGLDSPAIRNSSTHSIKEMGFQKMLQQLIDVSEDTEKLKNAVVRYYHNAKVGDRACYALEVSFEEKVPDLTFYRIEIFIDKQLELPIRLVMYDWPKPHLKKLTVLEEYTYVIEGINIGLTDQDFCHLNPNYGFKKFVARLSEQEAAFQQSVMKP
ncbi:MAG: DUF1571 domain-containing protein [Planctomycetia bacterium]|nr:DUF1571 domain-containing protein [Planctomycetia bacterium]